MTPVGTPVRVAPAHDRPAPSGNGPADLTPPGRP